MIVDELGEYEVIFAEHNVVYVTNEAKYTEVKLNGLLQSFFNLYGSNDNFPDTNELEATGDIENRFLDCNSNPTVFIAIYTLTDRNDNVEVAGGCILEYYTVSACGFVSYLFVKKNRRGVRFGLNRQKISDRLGCEVLPHLIKHIHSKHGQVKAILFAANNPINTINDSIDPTSRLRFFKKLGAKWIDFTYVQPPLNRSVNPVFNLNLYIVPELTATGSKLSIVTLMKFYMELTYSLAETDTNSYLYDTVSFNNDLQEIINAERTNKSANLIGVIPNSIHHQKNYIIDAWKEILKVSNDNFVALKELPLNEEPKINFKRASVCLQLLFDEDDLIPQGLPSKYITQFEIAQGKFDGLSYADVATGDVKNSPATLYCPMFHSFETALFAKPFQAEPPYFSKVYDLPQETIYMKVPTYTQYTSEGRIETRYLSAAMVESIYHTTVLPDVGQQGHHYYIPLRLSLSYTYFLISKVRVWHVILSSTPVGITEFDLIKLMKFFSGLQESESNETWTSLLKQYTFTVSPTENSGRNLVDFIFDLIRINYIPRRREISQNDMAKTPSASLRNIQSGLVQIDTDGRYIDFPDSGIKANAISLDQLTRLKAEVNKAYEFIYDNNRTLEEFLQNLSLKDSSYYKYSTKLIRRNTEYLFKALCGITQGIYDFERIGFEEVADTLEPRSVSKTKKSFLTVNRAVLTSFGYDDSVIDTTWRTTGFNPYTLISSTVLTQNDFVSLSAENALNKILINLRGKKIKYKNLGYIKYERDKIDSWLTNDILPNVFQYKTEQDLYDYGMEHMGINARLKTARGKLTMLKQIIDEAEAERSNRLQRNVQLFLSWITIVQIFPLVKDFIKYFNIDSLPEEQFFKTEWNWGLFYITPNAVVNLIYVILLGLLAYVGVTEIRLQAKERKQPLADFSDGYSSRNFL